MSARNRELLGLIPASLAARQSPVDALKSGGGDAKINVQSGSHTINAPLALSEAVRTTIRLIDGGMVYR